MSSSTRLLGKKFPFHDLPCTLEEYYQVSVSTRWHKDKEIFRSPESVKEALKRNKDFKKFWKKHCEGTPKAKAYLCDSRMGINPLDAEKMFNQYQYFLFHGKFSHFSTSEKERLKSDFDEFRPTLYQEFVENEAVRLNCDVSEVRPAIKVFPLEGDEGQLELCSLPNDVFVKILTQLETIELFRMTLVCRSWRNLIYQNAYVLTKAEHSLYTHLLTFTEWMDESKVVKGEDFIEHYRSSCWSLLNWCFNVSQNLETIVLHEIIRPYSEVMHLLMQCSNLKHLHFKLGNIDQRCRTKLQLPKLETLIIEDSDCKCTSEFAVQAFTSSNNLRVFKGQLYTCDIDSINKKRLNQAAFSNLMALQLISPESILLEKLATLDQLQLKYLYLWDGFRLSRLSRLQQRCTQRWIDKNRDALHHFLLKQNQLEVLVSLWKFGLDQNTIKLMTEQQQNLKSALLRFDVKSVGNEEGFDSSDGGVQTVDQNSLINFEEMLLKRDPFRDPSNFVFLVKDERSRSILEDAMTGFSIYQDGEQHSDMFEKWGLSHPAMRRRLGIDF